MEASRELSVIQSPATQNAITVWEQEEKIRELFAPNLSRDEFIYFVSLGKSLGANPFTREIWAVKYEEDRPASIFLGRDFYRRKAEELPDYNGHIVDAVYENDQFSVENGKVNHKYSVKNRGKLLGAYCVVFKKSTDIPFYVFVDFDEYNRNQSLWKRMPATMIKKVAEAQGLRGAFQGIFAGTYDESEMWDPVPGNEPPQKFQTQATRPAVEPEPAKTSPGPKNEEVIKDLENISKAGQEKISKQEANVLWAIAKRKGISAEELRQIVELFGYKASSEIDKSVYPRIRKAVLEFVTLEMLKKELEEEGLVHA